MSRNKEFDSWFDEQTEDRYFKGEAVSPAEKLWLRARFVSYDLAMALKGAIYRVSTYPYKHYKKGWMIRIFCQGCGLAALLDLGKRPRGKDINLWLRERAKEELKLHQDECLSWQRWDERASRMLALTKEQFLVAVDMAIDEGWISNDH